MKDIVKLVKVPEEEIKDMPVPKCSQCKKKVDDNKFTVIYDSSQSEKVNQTLAQMQKKDVSETKQTNQPARPKR